ncbi:MFS transporter [Bacillus sp. VT-16-64]|nr:MFS transporter [Bacillus sp. VT-16-64]
MRKPTFIYTSIGSGFFALTLVWTVYNAYMPIILGDFIESRAIRGSIMGLDNLLAVLLIPIIGAWSDRLKTPLGGRLPFLLVGMPLAALFFIILPFSSQTTLLILLIVDIIFLLAMTIFRAPVIALMPDHTPKDDRSKANGYINFMGGIGALIALFILAPLYDQSIYYPFSIGGILLFLAAVLLFFVVERNPKYAAVHQEENEEVKALQALKESASKLFHTDFRGHLFILLAIFLYFIGYSGLEAQFTVYATEHLQASPGDAGLTLGFFSLSFVVFAIPAGIIGTRLGKGKTMLLGLVFLPIVFFIMPWLSSMFVLKIILFIGGIAWAFINVQAYPLVADLGGLTKIGFFTGMYYLFSMSASVIAPATLGLTMDLFGHPALFYTAALTFVIAYLLLQTGIKQVKGKTA